mmetsp:Transcript_7965/g.29449  ORF Transcript_7965/g.29449 Transcript_7965/m.29449 type:complete len:90 (+) Transcript_7965:115-384(+)
MGCVRDARRARRGTTSVARAVRTRWGGCARDGVGSKVRRAVGKASVVGWWRVRVTGGDGKSACIVSMPCVSMTDVAFVVLMSCDLEGRG